MRRLPLTLWPLGLALGVAAEALAPQDTPGLTAADTAAGAALLAARAGRLAAPSHDAERPADGLRRRRLVTGSSSSPGRCQRYPTTPTPRSSPAVEAHVKHIFMKLDIDASADDHRRVLAVLAFLRG